ncbi:MAG: hypothetical protein WD830_11260 [Chloroflexota bacterium]
MRNQRIPVFEFALFLVAIYVLLQSERAPDLVLSGSIASACVVALVWPLAGLAVLAALGPFTEALTAGGQITAIPFLLAAVGLSVVLRYAAGRATPRPPLPLVLAIVLLIGTALGVVHSWLAFGPDLGRAAAESWVPGVGGAMTTLLAAAWLGAQGETRPLVVAVSSATLVAALAILDSITHGFVQTSIFGWLLRGGVNLDRLGGIIPAPNAAAAIFLVVIAVAAAITVFGRRPVERLAALLAAGIALVALALTYSRSGFFALGIVIAVVCWRRWGRLGLYGTVGVLAVAVALSVWAGLVRAPSPPRISTRRGVERSMVIEKRRLLIRFGAPR